MPRPPTPGSSTNIKGKDGLFPPPALAAMDSCPSSASTKSSASFYRPTSPISPEITPNNLNGASRRRASVVQANAKEVVTLPPPPTRSRKIIQMKPRGQVEHAPDMEDEVAKGVWGKKKQPFATSAAGRKIARKIAHSLIERRRRSKMNEEFGVLKSMIPACTGEMHKLDILRVSISCE